MELFTLQMRMELFMHSNFIKKHIKHGILVAGFRGFRMFLTRK